MNGFLCLTILLAGFPRGENSDYKMIADYTLYENPYDYIDSEGPWFGLFETDSVFDLRLVELHLTPNPPPPEDWERPSGVSVDILNETEIPLILISSSKTIFTEGPLSTAPHEYQHLIPDTSVILAAPGLPEYRLFVTEDGLFLSDDDMCQHITDTRPGPLHSSCFIGVVWAGDLDRDGVIDLLIDDVSSGYNYYDWNLYLSSEAGYDFIVMLVASFYDVYY